MHEHFSQSLSLLARLSSEEQASVTPLFRSRTFAKGDALGRQGEVARSLFFVTSGLLRLYHLDGQGTEHTIAFIGAGQWTGDLDSFFHQFPASLWLEALAETEVLELPYPVYAQEVKRLPALAVLTTALLRESQGYMQRRLIDQLSRTAEELYWRFLDSCPEISQHLTAGQIASFLGVSNECISRIRRRGAGKG